MSGFVGIVNLDGARVDFQLLQNLTNCLSFRGPDAQEVWCNGSVGLGHTLLQIPTGAALEKQPAQLDGRLWIVADGRIDARAEIIEKLKSKNPATRALSLSTPDAELILHAYDAWGEACVDHLLGDFSFAIWNAHRKRLFCARDHFGVKPFYYAHLGSCFIFSNTLNCLRMHPAVSSRLNDLAIADFLLFDLNQDASTTSFADIRRLPPAHTLTYEPDAVSIRRYWELSINTPISFSRDEEYIERFRELLEAAVADRLRASSAGVMMSGGLDSTTVAASAQRIFMRNGNPSALCAYTEVFDSLIPHEERHFASITADMLGIPIEVLVGDHWRIFERADHPEYRTPEPMHTAFPNTTVDQLRQVAARSRVVLTGYGGDPALCGRITVHFHGLIKSKQFGRLLMDAARFLAVEGRFSRLYVLERLRILFGSKRYAPVFPRWLNRDWERRFCLLDRWKTATSSATPAAATRPEAQRAMVDSTWTSLFELHDAGSTQVPVEVCHPIFDLRLVSFLIALPRLPWCSDKELLREAARGVLPDSVRLRRKSPLTTDPLNAILQRPDSAWVDQFDPVPELEQYVVRTDIPHVHLERNSWSAWIHLRPLSLNFWLQGGRAMR